MGSLGAVELAQTYHSMLSIATCSSAIVDLATVTVKHADCSGFALQTAVNGIGTDHMVKANTWACYNIAT